MSNTDWRADLKKLSELSKSCTDLAEPWAFFHDHLLENEAFMIQGFPKTNEKLTATLAAIGGKFLNRPTTPQIIKMTYVRDGRFWHGFCTLEGRPSLFFYFEQPDIGLISLAESFVSPKFDFFRFQLVELPPEAAYGFSTRGQA